MREMDVFDTALIKQSNLVEFDQVTLLKALMTSVIHFTLELGGYSI